MLKDSVVEKEKMIGNLVMELAKNTNSSASGYIISQVEGLNKEIEDFKKRICDLEANSVNTSSIVLFP